MPALDARIRRWRSSNGSRASFHRATAIAIGEAAGMLNPKIANLAKPGVELRGEIVVISDSDIRVGRDYLRALAASFASRAQSAR